jgi:hypothetical protein
MGENVIRVFYMKCFLQIEQNTKRKNIEKKVGEDGNKCDRCKFNCSVLAKTKTI